MSDAGPGRGTALPLEPPRLPALREAPDSPGWKMNSSPCRTPPPKNHRIVLWGRTEKCLKETTEEIRQMGTECHYFICDVGNREEVYQTAKAVREKVGDITILVNNAAVVHGKSLMDSDDDALLKSQHINTLGQFWTTKAFLPRMLELQNGHIVCLNSVLALSAIPGAIDYCTSKASAFAFMESLTLGLLDCPGVSATTVLPFHTSTEMFQGMRVRSVGAPSLLPAVLQGHPGSPGLWPGAPCLMLYLQDSGWGTVAGPGHASQLWEFAALAPGSCHQISAVRWPQRAQPRRPLEGEPRAKGRPFSLSLSLT
uniref:Short-chain dehydrogenase/reductase 3 n=1 Tax=Oryctolagus cuniculus TaxID=9986 RepID=U3KMM2_RABIT